MLGTLVAGLGSGLIGAMANASAGSDAKNLIAQSLAEYEKIGIPPVEAQQLLLSEFSKQGLLTPELEQIIKMGNSNTEGISTDPLLRNAQMDALSELQNIAGADGLRLVDQARLEGILSQINADERGSREAILSDMRAKGAMTSGNQLGAQLMNQQNAATNAYNSGLNTAALAQQNALNAIMGSSDLAGNIRGTDFDEAYKKAMASDEIDKFNTMATMDRQARNVDRINQAQAGNLSEAQRIADANTNLKNYEQEYNKNLIQKQFENQMNLSGAKANARSENAQNTIQSGKNTAAIFGGIGQGINQIGTAYQLQQDEEDKKRKALY